MGSGLTALTLLSGCSSTTGSSNRKTTEDSDDDGVPNEHDYAPKDPAVQSKSDIITQTYTSEATPTPTESPTPSVNPTPTAISTPKPTSTPTPTPTPTRRKTIQADSAPLEGNTHHPVEYSAEHATVRVYSELLNKSYPNGADLLAAVQGYPDTSRSDDILSYYRSNTFTPPSRGDTTVTVEFDTRVTTNVPIFYWFALIPSDKDYSSLNGDETDFLCETDRLRERNGDLTRSRHPDEPGDDTTRRYTRHSAEGCYALDFSGTSYSSSWDASFTTFKHGYIEDLNGQRYNDRRYYVYEALEDGLADEMGRILNEEAKANGITGDRQKIEFLIDFVQNLPYIPDDVSTGYDDYTKRHIETLVDGGGDCEDSSLMLASLLLSESFYYDTALLLLPGHAALGVKGSDDIAGTYFEKGGTRYYYIETTGRGWNVGEIPDEYRNEKAYVRVF